MIADAKDTEGVLWEDYWSSEGDRARNALLEHYLPGIKRLVKTMAAKFSMPFEDALSIACVKVLAEAIPGYRPGVNWDRYAYFLIRHALIDDLRRSRKVSSYKRKIQAARESLTQELGRDPTDAEVAESCGINESSVIRIGSQFEVELEDAAQPSRAAEIEWSDEFDKLTAGLPVKAKILLRSLFVVGFNGEDLARMGGVDKRVVSKDKMIACRLLQERWATFGPLCTKYTVMQGSSPGAEDGNSPRAYFQSPHFGGQT